MRLEPARLFRIALAASLTVSALLFFAWSWRWPLVGDASLIHYIAFLIERGMAPYRDLGDMNMPGSYLIEMAAMHLFGMGDLAWRCFDFTLLGLASASFFLIAHPGPAGGPSFPASLERVGSGAPPRPRERLLAALFASSLFILIHGRDGLAEGGQRDLTMAVCLLAATAFLFLAVRRDTPKHDPRHAPWAATAFGLLSGVAVTIKPTALPLTLVQIALALAAVRRQTEAPRAWLRYLVPAALAYLVAPAIALAFLLREHALSAFLEGFSGIIPYYASLGHRPFGFVLLHSISPLLPLVLLWLAVLALGPRSFDWTRDFTQAWERNCLLAGALFGLAACILQQRALPYYRYPLLAFLLPLLALDLTSTLESDAARTLRSRAARTLAIAALCFGGFFLAPQSAILIHRYRWWETDFILSLEDNLSALGGAQLSGRIHCIDSISGCGNVLYRMRLIPATGVLSDFLLFGPDSAPIVRQTRAQFSEAVLAHPPQVIVVTSHLHIDGPDAYLKLARWPAFEDWLAANYTLQTEWSPTRTARWWSREETPASYRIYVLRRPNP